MVATRKSLPNNNPTNEAPQPSSQMSRKQINALKKLNIDANDAILGGAKAAEKKDGIKRDVYHFRGSVYEKTGLEPEEWLQMEPERYKKRQSTMESEYAPAGTKAGRKRGREGDEREVEEMSKGRKKRKGQAQALPTGRRNAVVGEQGIHPQDESSEEEQEEEEDRMYTSRVFDYAKVGGHEEQSCMAYDREAAARRGYQVQPIPVNDMNNDYGIYTADHLAKLAKVNQTIVESARKYRDIIASLREYEDKYDMPHAELPQITPPPSTSPDAATGGVEIAQDGQRYDFAAVSPPPMPSHEEILAIANKGGQPLRWSLTSEKLRKGGKAEEAILRSRMEGESKQARRRRIAREMKIFKTWEVVEKGQ